MFQSFKEKEKRKTGSPTHTIRTLVELKALLNSQALTSIIIQEEAALDLKVIAELIISHHLTLKSIIIDGTQAQQTVFEEESTRNLAGAITRCKRLTVLAIENFNAAFRDSIKHLATCWTALPALHTLSLSHTFLTTYVKRLSEGLSESTTITNLNLTNSALTTDDDWWLLGKSLSENMSITKLILGNSPIWVTAIFALSRGIASNCSIDAVDWRPLSFFENETLYLNMCTLINWKNDPLLDKNLATTRFRLIDLQRNGEPHPMEEQYQDACHELQKLQGFLDELNHPEPITSLIITIEDRDFFNLDFIAARIACHSDTLQNIELKYMRYNKAVNSNHLSESVALFIAALKTCSQLQTLRIDCFQNIFQSHMEAILQAIAELPSLQTLGLNRTYLEEAGTLTLSQILKRNTLNELDLTLSGLVSSDCFNHLAEALRSNSSLRKITFGRSPISPLWMGYLTKAIEENPQSNLRMIDWQNTTSIEMNSKIESMCQELNRPSTCVITDTESLITSEWEKLTKLLQSENQFASLHTCSTYQRLSARLGSKFSDKEVEIDLEAGKQRLSFTTRSPLNNHSKPKINYGTASLSERQPKSISA